MAPYMTHIKTADAARQLGVHPAAVLRYFHSGILRGTRVGKKDIWVEQRAVIALMKVIECAKKGPPIPPHVRKRMNESTEGNGRVGRIDNAEETAAADGLLSA